MGIIREVLKKELDRLNELREETTADIEEIDSEMVTAKAIRFKRVVLRESYRTKIVSIEQALKDLKDEE